MYLTDLYGVYFMGLILWGAASRMNMIYRHINGAPTAAVPEQVIIHMGYRRSSESINKLVSL